MDAAPLAALYRYLRRKENYATLVAEINNARIERFQKEACSYEGADPLRRISCDREKDVCRVIQSFIEPCMASIPFPSPFSVDDAANVISENVAGLDLDDSDERFREQLLSRVIYFLAERHDSTSLDACFTLISTEVDFRSEVEPFILDRIVGVSRFAIPLVLSDDLVYREYHDLATWKENSLEELEYLTKRLGAGLAELWVEKDKPFADLGNWKKPIWQNGAGASLHLVPVLESAASRDPRIGEVANFVVLLSGEFTAEAAKVSADTLKSVVPCILEVIADSARVSERRISVDAEGGHELVSHLESQRACHLLDRLRCGLGTVFGYDASVMLRDGIEILRKQPCKEDELEFSIGTAFRLLESERQVPHDGVGLSLCFAAVESLLLYSKIAESPTETLKSGIPALFQPDGEKRAAARKQIAKLYDCRSAVMHGRDQEVEAHLRRQARRMAAGVLRSVLCLRNHYYMAGSVLTKKELALEIVNAVHRGHEIVGCPDLSDLLPQNIRQ